MLTALVALNSSSQSNNPFVSARPAVSKEQLDAIDKAAEEIKNNIGSYQKKEKFKDSTGYRSAYYNGKELQLVSSFYHDTVTEKHVDWYFQNSRLIFSVQLWIDKKTKDTLDYERYYLSNEQLIAWFKFNQLVERNTVLFKKLNYRMQDYIYDLKGDNRK